MPLVGMGRIELPISCPPDMRDTSSLHPVGAPGLFLVVSRRGHKVGMTGIEPAWTWSQTKWATITPHPEEEGVRVIGAESQLEYQSSARPSSMLPAVRVAQESNLL
jgi:hypothetical protein